MELITAAGYPRLAVTMGDPAGIGAEVVLKALGNLSVKAQITVVGTTSLWEKAYLSLTKRGINGMANPAELSILDVGLERETEAEIRLGRGNAASGAASFAYLEAAIARTLAGEFDGIVTAPIAKSLWKAAGHDYPGQTEVLATISQTDKFGMLFVARSPHTNYTLRTLLATTHIPLRQVPDALNPELMSRKLDLLVQCLHTDFGIETPTIAISGLNPHSGEAGQLGTEEVDWLISWIESEQKNRPHLKLIGPVPPDTLWVKVGQAWYNSSATNIAYDGYLALYHDQGLIPVKMLAFDYAINTTIGLPFIRTSPDHGTAFDIANQGIANPTSMQEAIKLATDLTTQRMPAKLVN